MAIAPGKSRELALAVAHWLRRVNPGYGEAELSRRRLEPGARGVVDSFGYAGSGGGGSTPPAHPPPASFGSGTFQEANITASRVSTGPGGHQRVFGFEATPVAVFQTASGAYVAPPGGFTSPGGITPGGMGYAGEGWINAGEGAIVQSSQPAFVPSYGESAVFATKASGGVDVG